MTTDFTSALFLGLHHGSGALAPWSSLTTGRPPILDRSGPNRDTRRLSRLAGAADAVVERTALHALIDAFAALVPRDATVLIDEHAYPIAHWAAATVALRGGRVVTYRHHHQRSLERACRTARRPAVVVTDGWCNGCSQPAPLGELVATAQRHGARVIVDDSLGFGVIGARRHGASVFGAGGGGTFAYLDVAIEQNVVVVSLAKGLGVPVAALLSDSSTVDRVRRDGPTLMHASGPTAADLASLRHALSISAGELERRRAVLAEHTVVLRESLTSRGVPVVGSPFPIVQAAVADPVALHRVLASRGHHAVMLQRRCRVGAPPTLAFVLRSDHTHDDLDALVRAIRQALSRSERRAA